MLIDTHCHIHDPKYQLDASEQVTAAKQAGVAGIVLCGETAADSKQALKFTEDRINTWATVGIHPHHATSHKHELKELTKLAETGNFIAVGECGLDYWYENAHRADQMEVFEHQLRIAHKLDLPLSIHIRGEKSDSETIFNDFFKLFDTVSTEVKPIRAVIHSFTAGQTALTGVLSRGLYVGLNGIATFANADQLKVFNNIPLENLVLETDAPYLTPVPNRGKINAPKNLVLTAEFIAKQRGISFETLAAQTTENAEQLFKAEVK